MPKQSQDVPSFLANERAVSHSPTRRNGLSESLRELSFEDGEAALCPEAATPLQAKAAPGAGLGDGLEPTAGARQGVDLRAEAPGQPLPEGVGDKMERAFGADFSGVRLHETGAVQALGALALARGSEIHVAPGTDLESAHGQELLGHELAHVQQQAAGRVSAPQPKGGGAAIAADPALEAEADRAGVQAARGERVDGARGDAAVSAAVAPVQAKLAGTTDVLISKGGAPSKSARSQKTDWFKLLNEVRAYEPLEQHMIRLLDTPRPHGVAVAEHADKLLGGLGRINRFISEWLADKSHQKSLAKQADNDEDADELRRGRHRLSSKEQSNVDRGVVITQLRTRVAREEAEVGSTKRAAESASWPRERGLFAEDIRTYAEGDVQEADDNAVGGQMSKLDKVTIGGRRGYFQKEARRIGDTVGTSSGIGRTDPNLSGRAVAMYRLAKLLGIGDRIVETHFATHERQNLDSEGNPDGTRSTESGIWMETAAGVSAKDAMATQQMNLTAPLVQQGLNQLQVLDALCGQVDRNVNNFFFDPSTGMIKGIDNDMAFGDKITTLAGGSRDVGQEERGGSKLKALPTLVDAKLGRVLMTLDPQLVRDALAGLLETSEVEATLARLAEIQTHLNNMTPEKFIEEEGWNQETAYAQTGGMAASYLQDLAGLQEYVTPELEQARGDMSYTLKTESTRIHFLVHSGKLRPDQVQAFVAEVDALAKPLETDFNARKTAFGRQLTQQGASSGEAAIRKKEWDNAERPALSRQIDDIVDRTARGWGIL